MTLSYYTAGRPARGAGRASAPSSGCNTLSHRPDCPPGTTLFTPASMCVPPALHTKVTERDPSAPLPHRTPAPPGATDGAPTTYAAAHRAPEGIDYSIDPRVRRPAAITGRSAHPPSPEAAAFGSTTYRMELLQRTAADINGDSCAAGGHHSRHGTAGLSASAPGSPAHRSGISAALPGYLTTSAAATSLLSEKYAAVAAAAPAHPQPTAVPGAACASASTIGPSSARSSVLSGSQAAGCFCDPLAALERPAGRGVAPGAGQAGPTTAGQHPRPGKDAAFLYALDQHSRGRVPGYTGHRPRHNVALQPPPPTSQTTWGAASQAALKRPLPPNTANHGIKSSLLGFFSAGTAGASQGFVSENGLTEAARFYETTRPLEGRMRAAQPHSHTTRCGGKFFG